MEEKLFKHQFYSLFSDLCEAGGLTLNAMIPVEASHSAIHQAQIHISNNDTAPHLASAALGITSNINDATVITNIDLPL